MRKATGDWFQSARVHKQAALKLFCFPYAGGSAAIYKNWIDHLPQSVQVIPVELPGRGGRLSEPSFVHLPTMIESLSQAIRRLLDVPFAFFGHSMGAVIAFELARRLRHEIGDEPQMLFVSGRRAPQISENDPVTYDLPDQEFKNELRRLDGTPREVLENEELMGIMIPVLRSDFQVVQTYRYTADSPLRSPITVFGGLQDSHVPREVLLPWREQTSAEFSFHMLPGDHFFLRSSQANLLRILGETIDRLVYCPQKIRP